MRTVEVVVHHGGPAIQEGPLFVRHPLVSDAPRALRLLYQQGGRITPGRLLLHGDPGLRPPPNAPLLRRLSLAAEGGHRLGSLDTSLVELFIAQIFRLVAKELGQPGALRDTELDHRRLVPLLRLAPSLPLDVPGRAVVEVELMVRLLDVVVALRPLRGDLPGEISDLLLVGSALDPVLAGLELLSAS